MTKWQKYLLIVVAIGGFSWVSLGAMTGHAAMPEPAATYFAKAHRYHIVHVLALFALAAQPFSGFRLLMSLFWLGGIICFSGSLYMMALENAKLNWVVPIGGMAFLFGWMLLALDSGLRSTKK